MGKYIGDKDFFKRVFTIIIPIMLQQLFLSIAGYIDNIMINAYDELHLAYNGVSAANRLMFVCNFVWLGLIAAVNIFTSQYFGAKDREKVKETLRFSIYISVAFAILGFIIITLIGNYVVDSYIMDQNAREYGYQYLDVIRYGNVFVAINMSIANGYRSIKKPNIPLVIGAIGIVVNIFMNWVLIFGHLGAPEMGASGAALATNISKAVETVAYFVSIAILNNEWFKGTFHHWYVSKDLMKKYLKRGTPLVANELFWSLSMVVMAKFYTYHNDMWYNAYAYTQNISDLFFIVFAGLGSGTSIIIGSTLGEGNFDKARVEVNYFRGLGVMMGGLVGILMAATSPLTSRVFTSDPEVISIMIQILSITSIFTSIYCYNAVCFFTLRAGGDSLRAVILDQGPTYLVGIPIAIVMGVNAEAWGITIVTTYLATHALDIVKLFLSNAFIRKEKWVRNLTVKEEN